MEAHAARSAAKTIVVLGLATIAGCSLLTSLDGLSDSSTSTTSQMGSGAVGGIGGESGVGSPGAGGAGGPSACADVCGTPGCGICPNAATVDVDGLFDIDAHEVTAAQYQAFLEVDPDPAHQAGVCLWNVSFAPAAAWCGDAFDPTAFPGRPVACVDWCDAAAYCAWTGRRVCGKIGGGVVPEGHDNDPSASAWFRACSANGTRSYPYGSSYSDACNTEGGGPVDVGSRSGCVGGYPGLWDMSGNVYEWEDSCDLGMDSSDPSDDGCVIRGGAWWGDASGTACDYVAGPHRNDASDDWGIRCCSN